MNQIKQHTAQWRAIKKLNLGANDIASLLGVGFNDPSRVIESKIHGTEEGHSPETQKLLDMGNRYEPIVKSLYEQRHGVTITATGLKRYREPWTFITASPDGYCKEHNCLMEFKVRKQLSDKVPMKYWVQMQVQMAVWDIDSCMYCENVIDEVTSDDGTDDGTNDGIRAGYQALPGDPVRYWKLVDYREQMVHRNHQWWESVFDQICSCWNLIEQGRSSGGSGGGSSGGGISTRGRKRKAGEMEDSEAANRAVKRRAYLHDMEKLVQPYMLSNYVRNDPLLDWLNLYGPPDRKDKEVNIFLTLLKNKKHEFSSLVRQYIEQQMGAQLTIYDAAPLPAPLSLVTSVGIELPTVNVTYESVERTKEAIAQKVPIIFNPCFSVNLPDYPYPIGGHADMIVLNKYIGDILGIFVVPDNEDAYTVVSFKYATINLRADQTHLLNNQKQRVYKSQLWLLNRALGELQGWVPDKAYIIGRKYDYVKRGITYRINHAFKSIGTVDFSAGGTDSEYHDSCMDALRWLVSVRSPEAAEWKVENNEQLREELYPNMKNRMLSAGSLGETTADKSLQPGQV